MSNQDPTSDELTSGDSLLHKLTHPDRSVRRQAALALGKMKAPEAVDSLIILLADHQTVWDAAPDVAWALGEIGDLAAVEPLIAVLEQPNVAGRAIEALAKLADQHMVEPLIRLFKRQRVSSIATILGNFGDQRAVEPMIDALEDPDPSLRFYAARALGKLRDKRALPALERARAYDTKPILGRKSLRGKSVSDAATKAIARIGADNDE